METELHPSFIFVFVFGYYDYHTPPGILELVFTCHHHQVPLAQKRLSYILPLIYESSTGGLSVAQPRVAIPRGGHPTLMTGDRQQCPPAARQGLG